MLSPEKNPSVCGRARERVQETAALGHASECGSALAPGAYAVALVTSDRTLSSRLVVTR
jgi:hypothetical protein